MKKLILFALVLVFEIFNISAQNQDMTIGLTGGYTPDGYAANVNFNYYLYDDSYIQVGIYTGFSNSNYKDYKIPYQILTLNVGYFYTIMEDYRQYTRLAIGGGLATGYELVNNGKSELPNGALIDSNSKFIYGPFVSGEFDFAITNRIWLVAKFNEYYHINSEVGNFTLYAGGGIRFSL